MRRPILGTPHPYPVRMWILLGHDFERVVRHSFGVRRAGHWSAEFSGGALSLAA